MRRLVLVLLFLPGLSRAQFINYLIDSASVKGIYPHNPSVAINPKNPDILVAGASPYWVYRSADRGKTWVRSRLLCPYQVTGNPLLLADFKGQFYYSHFSEANNPDKPGFSDRIVIQTSVNEGKNWDAGIATAQREGTYPTGKGVTLGRDGSLYVVWTEVEEAGDGSCKSNILLSKAPGGKKFNKPVRITATDRTCDKTSMPEGVQPAVANDGKIFVAWAQDGKIYLDRSWDGGNMWLTNDILITNQPGGNRIPIPGMGVVDGSPKLVIDQSKGRFSGAIYLIWTDTGDGHADIWFMRSFNLGDNWTSPIRIHTDDGLAHQFAPSMAVDPETGYIYIVFYDRRNHSDNSTDVYLAWSSDNGSSFKNIKLSESPFKPDFNGMPGIYTHIAAYNGVIIPVWTRVDGTRTTIWTAPVKQWELEKPVK
ncbi:MAG: sialidase family protein [Cyclobacteriaceae bacterium]|nr:sialidase family protein [Cyclobacteriaceae bacterium]